jgi:hypothetical protein
VLRFHGIKFTKISFSHDGEKRLDLASRPPHLAETESRQVREKDKKERKGGVGGGRDRQTETDRQTKGNEKLEKPQRRCEGDNLRRGEDRRGREQGLALSSW